MKSGIQIRIKTSWIRHTVCNNRDPIAQIFQPGWTRQVGPDRLDQTGWTSQAGPDRLDQTGWTRQVGPDRLDQTGWTTLAGPDRRQNYWNIPTMHRQQNDCRNCIQLYIKKKRMLKSWWLGHGNSNTFSLVSLCCGSKTGRVRICKPKTTH